MNATRMWIGSSIQSQRIPWCAVRECVGENGWARLWNAHTNWFVHPYYGHRDVTLFIGYGAYLFILHVRAYGVTVYVMHKILFTPMGRDWMRDWGYIPYSSKTKSCFICVRMLYYSLCVFLFLWCFCREDVCSLKNCQRNLVDVISEAIASWIVEWQALFRCATVWCSICRWLN